MRSSSRKRESAVAGPAKLAAMTDPETRASSSAAPVGASRAALLLAGLLSAGGLGLGFFMVHEGYDSVAAWIAVTAAVLSAAIVAGRAGWTR